MAIRLNFTENSVQIMESDEDDIREIPISSDRFVLNIKLFKGYSYTFKTNTFIISNCSMRVFVVGTMNYAITVRFENCNIKTMLDYNNYYTYLSYNTDHIKRVYRDVFYTDINDIYIGLVENKIVKKYMISMSI